MKVYLAGCASFQKIIKSLYIPSVLESFFYFRSDWQLDYIKDKNFLLDSGAFTFMMDSGRNVDWDNYVERYADFINTNKIKYFFELDIDSIVGYDVVKKLRKKLEKLTGLQAIPVWHLSRGKEEFLRHCDEYGYVAIGGIVSGEIKPRHYKYFPWFIDKAHDKNSLIHGLGFTNMAYLDKYHFDSVDSTAWLSGGRFGSFYVFHNGKMQTIKKPVNCRVADISRINEHNLKEWIKFQKYAETHL